MKILIPLQIIDIYFHICYFIILTGINLIPFVKIIIQRRFKVANYSQRIDESLLINMDNYIKKYQAEKGSSPTQREIAGSLPRTRNG